MGRESSQYDISDFQLQAASLQPGECKWTEIGEPKITYTVSGRAKVRQVSDQGNNYLAWLLTALAVSAIASVVWVEWIGPQLGEQLQSAAPPAPPIARVRISTPAYQPEYAPLLPANTPAEARPVTPLHPEINTPATSQMSATQQLPGLKPPAQMAANPVAAQSLKTGNPQPVQPATNNSLSKNQADLQQLPKLSAPIRPPVASTAATRPATQPEPNVPAAVVTRAAPVTKETGLPPAGDIQAPVPASTQQ